MIFNPVVLSNGGTESVKWIPIYNRQQTNYSKESIIRAPPIGQSFDFQVTVPNDLSCVLVRLNDSNSVDYICAMLKDGDAGALVSVSNSSAYFYISGESAESLWQIKVTYAGAELVEFVEYSIVDCSF